MKTKLLLSNNGWEYHSVITITHPDDVELQTLTILPRSKDSMGESTPDTLVIGGITIEFEEGFEVQEGHIEDPLTKEQEKEGWI